MFIQLRHYALERVIDYWPLGQDQGPLYTEPADLVKKGERSNGIEPGINATHFLTHCADWLCIVWIAEKTTDNSKIHCVYSITLHCYRKGDSVDLHRRSIKKQESSITTQTHLAANPKSDDMFCYSSYIRNDILFVYINCIYIRTVGS